MALGLAACEPQRRPELSEFQRNVLEAIAPAVQKRLRHDRPNRRLGHLPSRFMLAAAMNRGPAVTLVILTRECHR